MNQLTEASRNVAADSVASNLVGPGLLIANVTFWGACVAGVYSIAVLGIAITRNDRPASLSGATAAALHFLILLIAFQTGLSIRET